MKERIKTRLEELQVELEKGHKQYTSLQNSLVTTLDAIKHIEGAIAVCQEMLQHAENSNTPD